jgi:hypothetical protein
MYYGWLLVLTLSLTEMTSEEWHQICLRGHGMAGYGKRKNDEHQHGRAKALDVTYDLIGLASLRPTGARPQAAATLPGA